MPEQIRFDFERATFDLAEGERRKELGREQASITRKQLLGIARLVAVKLARKNGEVTSDDVFRELLRAGYDPLALGPAAGNVFRGQFEFTGRLVKSKRISNHASDLRVWRLKEAA